MTADELYARSPVWLQNVLLNVHAARIYRHRYGRALQHQLRALLESEAWSDEQLRAYQNARLKEIVRTAYARTRYYRHLMDEAGVTPGDIQDVDDLGRLPILRKDALRSDGAGLLTGVPARGWLHGHTSGTTGSPLSLWYSRDACVMNNAVDLRQKRWGGMRDGDWIGNFLGRLVVPPSSRTGPFHRVNHVHRQVWFSSFHLNDATLPAYVEEIRKRRLHYLEGYPSTLHIVASYVRRHNETLPMRAVFTSSETLHDVQREVIEAAFSCRLFDFYGHAERTVFACECEHHDGKHVAEEYGLVEIVDAQGAPVAPGTPGFLVGTSLHNVAMPMIRYWTGDVSALRTGRCRCGRTSRIIENVTTKAEDIIVAPDGRLISPSILTHPFKPFTEIIRSQLIQESVDLLRVKIVPASDFTQEKQDALVASIRERLGPEMHVTVELVDDIAREPSGKYRWVISRVDHACLVSWDAV